MYQCILCCAVPEEDEPTGACCGGGEVSHQATLRSRQDQQAGVQGDHEEGRTQGENIYTIACIATINTIAVIDTIATIAPDKT